MNRKINILYVTRSLELGGAERIVCDLAANLDSKKYRVTVCTFKPGPLTQELIKNGVDVINIERRFRYDPLLIWKLFHLILKKNIDIVHSHMFQSSLYILPIALMPQKLIFIINEHGGYLEIVKVPRRRYLYKFIAKVSKMVVVVSQALKDDMIKFFNIPSKKIAIIYNGIKMAKFTGKFSSLQMKKILGLESDIPIVGNVANLRPEKGHKYLLEAMSLVLNEIPNAKLIIIGEGALRAELENQTKVLGISESVIFLGRRQDVPALLNIMDIFVISSSGETFCIAAAEAMAMGKPVVASRVGGVPELVIDSKTGFLVPPKDPPALAEAVIKLLKDRKLALDMGQAGKERVRQEFTLDKMVKKTEQLYESLIKEQSLK